MYGAHSHPHTLGKVLSRQALQLAYRPSIRPDLALVVPVPSCSRIFDQLAISPCCCSLLSHSSTPSTIPEEQHDSQVLDEIELVTQRSSALSVSVKENQLPIRCWKWTNCRGTGRRDLYHTCCALPPKNYTLFSLPTRSCGPFMSFCIQHWGRVNVVLWGPANLLPVDH